MSSGKAEVPVGSGVRAADLRDRVLAALPAAAGYVVALSGGADSMTLLALLAGRVPVRAVHVQHGLQPAASAWPAVCAGHCGRLGVPFETLVVAGEAPAANREAWAREQRYALLAANLQPHEVVLTAHHADDQAETVLLNLLRGSGLDGLAAMPGERGLGAGRLARPLLGIGRDELRAGGRQLGLSWVTDPSNRDLAVDRNFLRHEVLPRLRQHWPAAGQTLARSAAHLGQSLAVEQEMLAVLLRPARRDDGGLDLAALTPYSQALRTRLLMRWLTDQGLRPPRVHQWPEIWRQLEHAAGDREVCLTWPGVTLRRYRAVVHVADVDITPSQPRCWALQQPLHWPGYGVLTAHSWPASWERAELQVRAPAGGERIRLRAGGQSRRLRTLWQAAGVPPWQRRLTPLLYRGDELVAVGERWVAASASGLHIALRCSP